jgi:predicted transcriptional regulator
MSPKRQHLIDQLAALPDDVLDDVQESVNEIVRWHQDGVFRLSDEERIAVRKGMEAARRGEFVPDDEMAVFARRHRP